MQSLPHDLNFKYKHQERVDKEPGRNRQLDIFTLIEFFTLINCNNKQQIEKIINTAYGLKGIF